MSDLTSPWEIRESRVVAPSALFSVQFCGKTSTVAAPAYVNKHAAETMERHVRRERAAAMAATVDLYSQHRK